MRMGVPHARSSPGRRASRPRPGRCACRFLVARDSGALTSVSANSVGVIDPASNTLVADIPVGVNPEGVALDRDSAWVATRATGASCRSIEGCVRSSRQSRSASTRPTCDLPTRSFGLHSPSIEPGVRRVVRPLRWSASPTIGSSHFVAGLDWFTYGIRQLQGRARIEGRACVRRNAFLAVDEVALGEANPVWLGCDSFLSRAVIGTKAGSFARVDVSAVSPWFSDVALGLGSIWLTDRAADTVAQIDPATRREVRLIEVGDEPTAIAVGLGSVWVTNFESDTVTRIEPSGARQPVRIETISVGDGPTDVAVGGNAVWVVNGHDGTVERIDAETKRVVATVTIGNEPRRVAASETDVWVTVRGAVGRGPGGREGFGRLDPHLRLLLQVAGE